MSITIASDLSGLRSRSFSRNQLRTACVHDYTILKSSVVSTFALAAAKLCVVSVLMKQHSITGNDVSNWRHVCSKKNGPRTDPCGTSDVQYVVGAEYWPILTNC